MDGLGSGAGARGAPHGAVAAAKHAFVDALGTGLLIASGAIAVAALLAWALIAPAPPASPQAAPTTDALDGELIAGPQPEPARA